MSKQETMKDILSEAKEEIFEGKSTTVKNNIHALIGKVDGINARKAIQLKKIDKELADAEAELKRFTALGVDEAFNEVTVSNQQTQSGQYIYGLGGMVYSVGTGL